MKNLKELAPTYISFLLCWHSWLVCPKDPTQSAITNLDKPSWIPRPPPLHPAPLTMPGKFVHGTHMTVSHCQAPSRLVQNLSCDTYSIRAWLIPHISESSTRQWMPSRQDLYPCLLELPSSTQAPVRAGLFWRKKYVLYSSHMQFAPVLGTNN